MALTFSEYLTRSRLGVVPEAWSFWHMYRTQRFCGANPLKSAYVAQAAVRAWRKAGMRSAWLGIHR